MQLRPLALVAAVASALSCQPVRAAVPETVELDLVFPRNETYRPVYPFPIVFALRNPAVIWPFDFTFVAKLEWWSDEEDRVVSTRAGFRQLGHHPNAGYPYNDSPVYPDDSGEPLFFINATFVITKLMNSTTTTPATVRWNFGLDRNCTANVHPDDTVGRPPQMAGHINLSFAPDGALPDFGDAYNDKNNVNGGCPIGLGAINIAGQMPFDEPRASGVCPILYEAEPTPEPDPCQVTVDEQLGSRVSSAMMASERCDEGAVWPNPTATSCEQMMASFGARGIAQAKASLRWAAPLALAIAAVSSIF